MKAALRRDVADAIAETIGGFEDDADVDRLEEALKRRGLSIVREPFDFRPFNHIPPAEPVIADGTRGMERGR